MLAVDTLTAEAGGRRVLGPLTLNVAAGELLVLAGPSGSGKSSLLRALAGLAPSDGRITLDGRDLAPLPPGERGIAMVFQNYALFPHLTVQGNLEFGPRARGDARDLAARVKSAAEALSIGPLLKRFPRELSGGERQRVALARALIRRPRLLLLDEPLSNLDAPLRAQARAEILRLHRELGGAAIYVTHDQQEAMALGDRLGLLHEGVLRQLGTPAEVYARPVDTFCARFLGQPPMNLLPDAQGRLAGIRAEHIAIEGSRWSLAAPLESSATLTACELMGDHRLLHLRMGEAALYARVEPEFAAETGRTLRIGLTAEHLRYFDASSGRALG